MQRVEDLDVFRMAHKLTLQIYAITAQFPKDETFGLTSQMRRASVSICSNLAEGAGRESRAEFHRFTSIAKGSVRELSYQLMLVNDLGYMDEKLCEQLMEKMDYIQRMLSRLMTSLRKKG